MTNKALEGEYISIDDVDKDMASLAVMMLASLKNSEKSLPSELENSSSEEILERLTTTHFAIIEKLDRLIKREFSCDETLYDIISASLDAIDSGKEPKEIIDAII